jgi:hypothetical protein
MNAALTYGILRKSRITLIAIFLLITMVAFAGSPDEWRGGRGIFILEDWSLNLNVGFTSYYGDLSQYDANYIEKLIFESKPAAGVKLTKYVHPLVGIAGQLIYGGFRSEFLPDHSFNLELLEYNLQVVVDATPLIFRGRSMPFGMEVSAGAGQFLFQTSVISGTGEQQSTSSILDGTPEFVYFFGGTFYYRINPHFRATADLSIRQAQNDNIDKYINSDDYDYYSWFSVGISWMINTTFSLKRYKAMNKVNKHPPRWR